MEGGRRFVGDCKGREGRTQGPGTHTRYCLLFRDLYLTRVGKKNRTREGGGRYMKLLTRPRHNNSSNNSNNNRQAARTAAAPAQGTCSPRGVCAW
jgi:hypothetical protein